MAAHDMAQVLSLPILTLNRSMTSVLFVRFSANPGRASGLAGGVLFDETGVSFARDRLARSRAWCGFEPTIFRL
jgi:hypothetical protein